MSHCITGTHSWIWAWYAPQLVTHGASFLSSWDPVWVWTLRVRTLLAGPHFFKMLLVDKVTLPKKAATPKGHQSRQVFFIKGEPQLDFVCYDEFQSNSSRNPTNPRISQLLPVVHISCAINTFKKNKTKHWNPTESVSIQANPSCCSASTTTFSGHLFKPEWLFSLEKHESQEQLGKLCWSICALAKSWTSGSITAVSC